jgi:chromate transporter
MVAYFLGLGSWGFGGPIALVGYMQRDLVERKGWLERQDFLDGLALGQTMPGPLAAQLAVWAGYLRGGAWGGLATLVAFTLPSYVVVLIGVTFYERYQGNDAIQGAFYGVAPAVIAIIAVAAVKLARLTNGRDIWLWVIAAGALVVTAVTRAELALLFIGCGLLVMLWENRHRLPGRTLGLFAAGVPFVAVGDAGGTLLPLGLFFLKAGALIFGGGLAIVPFLREGVVLEHHWLTQDQFLDAVAIGFLTPGPLLITAAFIGYLVASWGGAAVATVAVFTPIYFGVIVPGPWFIRHRANPWVRGFTKGATAAAAGAIGGATIVLARDAIIDAPTTVIALLALGLLLVPRFTVPAPLVIALAGIAGVLLRTG